MTNNPENKTMNGTPTPSEPRLRGKARKKRTLLRERVAKPDVADWPRKMKWGRLPKVPTRKKVSAAKSTDQENRHLSPARRKMVEKKQRVIALSSGLRSILTGSAGWDLEGRNIGLHQKRNEADKKNSIKRKQFHRSDHKPPLLLKGLEKGADNVSQFPVNGSIARVSSLCVRKREK